MKDRQIALDLAAGHAARWLGSLGTRPVPPRASVAEVAEALGTQLPDGPTPAPEVIDLLANACDPGLTAMPSGRFYGMVIGGTRGHRERVAARSARPARKRRRRLRDRRDHVEFHLPGRRQGRRAPPGRLGRRA
jgi:hypothetical protein